ncbi:GNAT family N-acetyltransferase [Gordonia paraffinivorans]|uniref:GNAT family N-acetyltransferase n=1 Tax=Gordonia paraffinivorans TaxID=175628 RepID=UPI001445EADB|nr:GNAT family N-acetyltransferase [Gordonia paraffinivorans]
MTHHAESSGRIIRRLSASDRDAALDLLEGGLQEVPVYRWLLGEDASVDVFRWYGELLFVEHLSGLRGIFDESGALVALIAVNTNADEAGRADDDLRERSKRYITTIAGFAQRFRELKEKSAATAVKEDAIRVIFALVHPDHRRNGTLSTLVEPVIERGRREGLPITASSSDPALKELYRRKWGGQICAEFTLTDGPTVWVQRLDP